MNDNHLMKVNFFYSVELGGKGLACFFMQSDPGHCASFDDVDGRSQCNLSYSELGHKC